jgi:hypothetical protein
MTLASGRACPGTLAASVSAVAEVVGLTSAMSEGLGWMLGRSGIVAETLETVLVDCMAGRPTLERPWQQN